MATSSGVAISTSRETMIPLSAIASWALQNTPLAVNHQGQSVAATLSFNLAPGKSLSDAQRDVANATQVIGMPGNVIGSFQGTAQVYQQSLANEPILIAAALVAVYIVLGVSLRELRPPPDRALHPALRGRRRGAGDDDLRGGLLDHLADRGGAA